MITYQVRINFFKKCDIKLYPTPFELDLSHDHACTFFFFEDEASLRDRTTVYVTGGIGLNMNYSDVYRN